MRSKTVGPADVVVPRASGTSAAALALLLAVASTGCGDSDVPAPGAGTCEEMAGVCVGAPVGPSCSDEVCTTGVACSRITVATNDAELQAATASAEPGSCIALTAGQFGVAQVPAAVSLLGHGPGDTTVGGVVVAAGSGSVVRGMTVSGGGVRLSGATAARLEALRVVDATGDGVTLEAGASSAIQSVTIARSARYGVSAFDSGGFSLEQSVVEGGTGPGLWAQCAAGCDCPAPPTVTVSKSRIRENVTVGLAFAGVHAVVDRVDVTAQRLDDFSGSGGIVAFECALLEGGALRVLDNTGYGILVDHASATLGAPASPVEVSRNQPGVWIQHIDQFADQAVELDSFVLAENNAVSLGLGGESRGIMFWNSAVTGTKAVNVPVLLGGAATMAVVGDGISWKDGAQMDLKNVSLTDDERQAILIDGPVGEGSVLAGITLGGTDALTGVVQQNLPSGGLSPTVGPGAPSVHASPDELFAVMEDPAVPAKKAGP